MGRLRTGVRITVHGKDSHFLPVPAVAQSDGHSCGLAVAYMAAKATVGTNLQEIGQALNCTSEGTSQTELARGLRSLGVGVTVRYDLSIFDLKKILLKDRPVIVYSASRDHWALVYGFTGGEILVMDPDCHPRVAVMMSNKNYLKEYGRFGMTCSDRGRCL